METVLNELPTDVKILQQMLVEQAKKQDVVLADNTQLKAQVLTLTEKLNLARVLPRFHRRFS